MQRSKLGILYVLFFLLAAGTLAFIFFEQPIRTATRATNSTISPQKSLILSDKFMAKPQTESAIITVFARNSQGESLSNKSVIVTTSQGTITPTEGSTDATGKAVFTLSSGAPVTAEVKASINGVDVVNTVTVYFK